MAEVSDFPETCTGAKLLVVDDEANLRASLRDILSLMGYHVEEAASGYEALELLESTPYDLMVLDMRMPGMDGVEVMRRARRICPDLSIVVLTAHASLESAIAAVKSDVADYLLKPFDIEGLSVTISRALRERSEQLRHQQLLNLIGNALDTLDRMENPETPAPAPPANPERFLHAGPLTLDRQKRLIIVQGDPHRTAELTEGEAAILSTLMENPNQVLSWDRLIHSAMGYSLGEQEAQNQARLYIFRLRRKIEANPRKPRLIRTVRRRGYFLSLD
ncbi:MAG: response regulator transcription factor [Chloroflexota bacterium]|nr:response regulator transcription factor [Chloroflexota bacterium]